MLRSYEAAVRDPDDELIHLFEIRDALAAKLGRKAREKARAKLGITRAAWQRLGSLANDAPINQGRHRGEHAGKLRDATRDELEEARQIARGMLQAYLRSLESAEN